MLHCFYEKGKMMSQPRRRRKTTRERSDASLALALSRMPKMNASRAKASPKERTMSTPTPPRSKRRNVTQKTYINDNEVPNKRLITAQEVSNESNITQEAKRHKATPKNSIDDNEVIFKRLITAQEVSNESNDNGKQGKSKIPYNADQEFAKVDAHEVTRKTYSKNEQLRQTEQRLMQQLTSVQSKLFEGNDNQDSDFAETTTGKSRGDNNKSGQPCDDNNQLGIGKRFYRNPLNAIEKRSDTMMTPEMSDYNTEDDEKNYDDDVEDGNDDDSVERSYDAPRTDINHKQQEEVMQVPMYGTIRGISKTKARVKQKTHVAARIRTQVKNEIFRQVKFITNDTMFKRAFQLVIQREKVPSHAQQEFAAVYKSTFMEALNTKRSTCEQAARKIVFNALDTNITLNVDNFFTIEELSTLRQAETERQLEALVWFIGDFVESVAGRRTWGKLKYFQLVNEARDQATGKTAVTASDEAFALLLFENYSDKWFAQYKEAMEKDDNRHDNRNLMEATVQEKKRFTGKYTSRKNGQCEYGGWSKRGMERYNHFWHLVKKDREHPNAKNAERMVLRILQERRPQQLAQDERGDEDVIRKSDSNVITACWDLDY